MNTPSSLDECKAEIARYLDAFARSLPAQINAPRISRVKLPGIATWSRETLLWRFTGLALLAGTQNRVILGAKRGFPKSAREGDIRHLPLGMRQSSKATVEESRGCLSSGREDSAGQANTMPEVLENASIPRMRRNSIPINRLKMRLRNSAKTDSFRPCS